MQSMLRRVAAPRSRMPAGEYASEGSSAGVTSSPYRQVLLGVSVLVFVTHLMVLSIGSLHLHGSPWSDLVQLALGMLTILAMVNAALRSGPFAKRTWLLAALAMAAYTAGQAMITYYGYALYVSRNPGIKDQLFFFWMLPLMAAAAAEPREWKRGFDWTTLLDFGQLVLLAVALHIFVFG